MTTTIQKPLTPREGQVLELMCQGFVLKQIAGALFVSRNTVQKHSENLRRKLGARNQAHACALGIATGLVDPEIFTRKEST